MKLIDNWKKAWRMASVQVAAGAIAFGALMILARVVNQPKAQ